MSPAGQSGNGTADSGRRPFRVGIASFAHVHAAGYARLLQQRPDVDLVAADPDAAAAPSGELRGAELAQRLGVRLVPGYAAMFDEGLDAVVVCTETSRHRQVVETAAAAGVAVLCEKPLATTLEDARAMVQACRRAGVALMTAYPVRFHPAFASLRQSVLRGDLGRVLTVTGANNGQPPLGSRAWFGDPELAGGGALMDHTVHLADLYAQLLGRPAQVYAQVNRVLHEDVRVETGGLVVLTYPSGVVASIDCSWSAPQSYPSWGGLHLDIEGERGGVRFDAFAERLQVYDDRAGGLRWQPVGVDLDALMLEEMLQSVSSGRPPAPGGEVGVQTLEVVLAAYASAASGQPVPLP